MRKEKGERKREKGFGDKNVASLGARQLFIPCFLFPSPCSVFRVPCSLLRALCIGLMFLGGATSLAQGYFETYKVYCLNNDTAKQEETLRQWEKSNPRDPELFSCYFDYFLNLSSPLYPVKDSVPKNHYLQKAFEKISQGIELHPNRLDLRLKKIKAWGKLENWLDFKNEIIQTIRHSQQNNADWYWTNDAKLAKGEMTLLHQIENFQGKLLGVNHDSVLLYVQEISHEVLKTYPTHLPSLYHLGLTYILMKDYDRALEILHQTEDYFPHNDLVLMQIAHCYLQKENTKKAIAYFKKVVKHGERNTAQQAKQLIKELKSKH